MRCDRILKEDDLADTTEQTMEKLKPIPTLATTSVAERRLAETAALYADLPPIEAEAEESVELMTFQLSGEWYAFEMSVLEEIVRVGQVATIPRAPSVVLGLFNYLSKSVLLVDLRALLGVKVVEGTDESRIMVVNSQKERTGVLVDVVADVVSLPKTLFQPPIATIRGINAEFMRGVAKCQGKHLIWLDMGRIMMELKRTLRSEAKA